MTIQSPCNLAYTELEQLQMVDPEALFKRKLNIGHGGSLLVREKVHSSHYQTPSVSYSPLGGAVRTSIHRGRLDAIVAPGRADILGQVDHGHLRITLSDRIGGAVL